MMYATRLYRLATSASRRSMGCGFCKGFRLPILPFPNNKRLNTQKYPAFASQLLPAKNPIQQQAANTGFLHYLAAEAAAATLEAAASTIEAPADIASEAAPLASEAAELTAACALEAASTAAFCAAEAADAPSAATVEAASCAAEAAWLAAGLLSPQAASNKDIKATDSSDFFMFNTFKYFLSLNKKQNESAK